MKLAVYAAPPPCRRNQFSSGVRGQNQPANSTHAPQAAAGRCNQATRGQRATSKPPRTTNSTKHRWTMTVASARIWKTITQII